MKLISNSYINNNTILLIAGIVTAGLVVMTSLKEGVPLLNEDLKIKSEWLSSQNGEQEINNLSIIHQINKK